MLRSVQRSDSSEGLSELAFDFLLFLNILAISGSSVFSSVKLHHTLESKDISICVTSRERRNKETGYTYNQSLRNKSIPSFSRNADVAMWI